MADTYTNIYDPSKDPMNAAYGGASSGDGGNVDMGDRADALISGAAQTGEQIASAGRASADASGSPNAAAIADYFRTILKNGAQSADDRMSPDAKAQMESSLTSHEFWEHPISASLLKSLNMAPGVAAAVAPALLTDGLGAAAPAAVGGALGAGQSADDVYDRTDAWSDQEFQQNMPYYAGLRSMGVSEKEARADANTKLMGIKPIINAAANAAAMVLGPAGRVAGVIPEAADATLLRRVGVAGAEGALGGAIMGGTAEATHEQTDIALDQRTQLDPALIAAAAGDAGVTQGVMGAAGGIFTGGHEPLAKPRQEPKVETVEGRGPDAAQTEALNPEGPPAPPVAPASDPVPPVNEKVEPNAAPPAPPSSGPSDGEGLLTPAPDPAADLTEDDAGKTVPEAGPTLQAQQDQLVGGQRQAMLFPKGGDKPLPLPDGMKATVTKDGTFHFNPDHTKREDIYAASKAGELNKVLDLGDYSKKDLAPKLAAGETPLAVTERAPDGTEVKAAAGTTSTAPDQVASLEGSKTPGNKVQIETPAQVIQGRAAAAKAAGDALRQKTATPAAEPIAPKAPRLKSKATQEAPAEKIHVPHKGLNDLPGEAKARIAQRLESLFQVAEKQEAEGHPMKGGIEAFIARKREELVAQEVAAANSDMPVEEAAPRARAAAKNEGKKRTKAEVEKRQADNANAAKVVEQFQPHLDEQAFFRGKGMGKSMARDAVVERARAMVEAAEKEGINIPKALRDSKDKSVEASPALTLLTEARALIAERKGGVSDEHVTRFLTREPQLRSGEEADRQRVLAERRAEGDQKMAARSASKDIEAHADPEAEIAAERERLESVPDEAGATEPDAESEDETNEPRQEPLQTPKVELKGDEVNAVKDRAGTFKIETKKRPKIRRIGGGEVPFTDEQYYGLQNIHPTETRTLREYAGVLPKSAGDGAMNRILSPYITHRLKAFIGNIPVHLIPYEEMQSIVPNSQGFYINADGKPRIYLSEDLARDPRMMQHVLLHEGMHAALEKAIEDNPHLKQTVRLIMDEAKAYLGKNVGPELKYGFTDEHEFMSEAMSNPHFQDMLAEAKASNLLKSRLQLNSPLTLRDVIVHMIRQVLGIANNPHDFRLIEAALRVSNQLMAASANSELGAPRSAGRPLIRAMKAGDFTSEADADVNKLFHTPFSAAIDRGKNEAVHLVTRLTQPGKMVADTIEGAKSTAGIGRKILNAVTTDDQYRQKIEHLLPMVKQIMDDRQRTGVLANKYKEEGMDLTGAMIRAQKSNPGLFEKFAKLINEQTMYGADASMELGQGRNAHLGLSKALQDKISKGMPLSEAESNAAMTRWEARGQHPEMAKRYKEIVKQEPQYKALQKQLFDYYAEHQDAIARDQIDSILRTHDFQGTDAERAEAVDKIHSGNISDEDRADLETKIKPDALKLIEATDALKVKNGPYAPQMRRGEHAIIGEYKVETPKNGTKIDDSTYEFKDRESAHAFALKTGLHAEPKSVYYDTATGERVKNKIDAVSTVGEPEQRFQVQLQRNHLEFHESHSDAAARLKELQDSGLFDNVGLEERRHIESEDNDFSSRGVEGLLRSLANQKTYKEASDLERAAMRHTIREAGLRSLSDNRVQSRRLPRRYVQGASDDIARNLYDYNNSQANYRAGIKYRDQINAGLKSMWDHVKAERYKPDNEARSQAANEVERRMRVPDPNEYSGAYSDWTRRISTWSYIDRMMRPSHLILHQTHLPMITAPYMAGRHGVMAAYGGTLKAWKELTGFYSAGGHDAWATTWGSALQKGADYVELGKNAFAKAADGKRIGKMLDELGELGIIHPSAGIEVNKYLPSKQLGGLAGKLDTGLNKVDTIFRHLTNATEAVNRIAGATAAYRLEFAKLTRAGKDEASAHEGAVEYARQTLTDTQGLFSSTNAAPIFKNKFLKPFLQFKQFPQMMYHLLGKLAVQSLSKDTPKEVRVQAMASLASILGMHMMMAGVLQGLPLEPFKILALIAKGIGLTDSDWTNVEAAERRSIRSSLGNDVGDVVLNGLGSAALGVDVHHRLGLNSFVTYGMPDQVDSKSMSEFAMNALVGAPGALVSDTLKGVHKMMTGDIEGGALQAAPLQALRDIHNAVGENKNQYGFQPTIGDRVKMAAGFSPIAKVNKAEAKEAVYQGVQRYDQERNSLTKAWVSAPPAEREGVWQQIQAWNMRQPSTAARLTKGDLFKSMQRGASAAATGRSVNGVSVSQHSKDIATSTAGLYR
jgi:hypothetical protein